MRKSMEDAYFSWLCAKVEPTVSNLSYVELLKVLHSTEFVWLLVGDDNRAQDGIDLRDVFLREALLEDNGELSDVMCSVLEMLVAFSYKAEFQTDDSHRDWFWEFMDNLHLTEFSDDRIEYEIVEDILYAFVWRLYDFDGRNGGLFPLNCASKDQRKVEIWYQFSEYIIENDRI